MTFNVKHFVLPAMAVLLLAASPRPAAALDDAAKADAPKTLLQKRVDRAVKRAVEWFRKTQNVKGKGVAGAWSFREPNWESGVTSLVLFALLKSGVDREDAMVKAGFKYIADNVSPNKRPTEMYTYNVATQMLAIEAGYGDMLRSKNPGNPVEKTLRDIFDANFEYCKKALKAGEAGYTIDQEGIDLSNTQFLVMAFEAAMRAGYNVPESTWLEILDKGMKLQALDGPQVPLVNILSSRADEVDKHGYAIKDRYEWITGKPARARGWTYGEFFKKDEIYGSMTCAGIANLLSCFFVLQSNDTFKRDQEEKYKIAVRDGFAWLQKYYAVNANPSEPSFWTMGRRYEGDTFWTYYYLFTLARITTSTNIRCIGNRNWYIEGTDFLLKAQQQDGSWTQNSQETHNFKSDCIVFVNTAFALWFFSSLDFGKPGKDAEIAKITQQEGQPPASLENFRKSMTQMLRDSHRLPEHWDVAAPVEGTADVVYAVSLPPFRADWKADKSLEAAVKYLTDSVVPSADIMDKMQKGLKSTDTMTEYYDRHLLYERWRTTTTCRQITALLADGIDDKGFEQIAAAGAKAKPKLSSQSKGLVTMLVKHVVSNGKKNGDRLGWTDNCGRPSTIQPDCGNTAMVVRALRAAALCGIDQPAGVWSAAGRFIVSTQEESGPEVDLAGADGKPTGKKGKARGFALLQGDLPQIDVTMDAISALIRVKEHSKASGKAAEELDRAINDGFAWLQNNFTGIDSFETLVCVKRLGTVSGMAMIGGLDWKALGLKFIGYMDSKREFLGPSCNTRVAAAFYFMSEISLD